MHIGDVKRELSIDSPFHSIRTSPIPRFPDSQTHRLPSHLCHPFLQTRGVVDVTQTATLQIAAGVEIRGAFAVNGAAATAQQRAETAYDKESKERKKIGNMKQPFPPESALRRSK